MAASDEVRYVPYSGEEQLPLISALVDRDLSEPYSIYTYRYFLHNWPALTFLAFVGDECVGVVISKLDLRKGVRRGYVGMLAVDSAFRKRGIGSTLVRMSIEQMREMGCDEVVLEAEESNKGALALYLNLGFIKSKRLLRYYLNGSDAFRLKLWFS